MNGNSFLPPNCYVLSDTVVGVVPTRRKHGHKYLFEDLNTVRAQRSIQATQPSQKSAHTDQVIIQQISASSNHPSIFVPAGTARTMPSRASKRCSTEAVSQESWKKVQNKEVCLEDEVAQLQENVKRLEKQRDAISLSIPTKTATLNAVVEFFRLFRNGFHPVASVSDLCQASTSLKNDPAYVQTQFLQAITVHDFLSNAGYSVETALEDWRLISKQLENHSIELERVERGVGNSVVAYMNGVFTATETVLHSAFPELNTDSDGGKWAALAVKLLGKRLVVPSSFVFRFDDSNSRMLSAHYEADMLTPLLELLQSPGDVSLVLNSPLNVHHWSKE